MSIYNYSKVVLCCQVAHYLFIKLDNQDIVSHYLRSCYTYPCQDYASYWITVRTYISLSEYYLRYSEYIDRNLLLKQENKHSRTCRLKLLLFRKVLTLLFIFYCPALNIRNVFLWLLNTSTLHAIIVLYLDRLQKMKEYMLYMAPQYTYSNGSPRTVETFLARIL